MFGTCRPFFFSFFFGSSSLISTLIMSTRNGLAYFGISSGTFAIINWAPLA